MKKEIEKAFDEYCDNPTDETWQRYGKIKRCHEGKARQRRATAILQPAVTAQVEADGNMLWA